MNFKKPDFNIGNIYGQYDSEPVETEVVANDSIKEDMIVADVADSVEDNSETVAADGEVKDDE